MRAPRASQRLGQAEAAEDGEAVDLQQDPGTDGPGRGDPLEDGDPVAATPASSRAAAAPPTPPPATITWSRCASFVLMTASWPTPLSGG